MTDEERRALDRAQGLAKAALAMCHMLIHRLGADRIIPPQDLLAALELLSLAAEERVGRTPNSGPIVVEADHLSLFRDQLSKTLGFRAEDLPPP